MSEQEIQHLDNMIKGIKYAMLTTKDDDGDKLYSRPMYTADHDFGKKELWFFTQKSSWKCAQIEHDHRVGVTYSDSNTNTFVSISGNARLVMDKEKIKQLYSPMLKAWFPKGVDDPEIALLRVDIQGAEYWDSSSSRMVYLFKVAKAIATGEGYKPSEGEHNVVNLKSKA